MLVIKKLSATAFWLAFTLLAGCSTKTGENTDEAVEIDSADFYQQSEDETAYDYSTFQGIYDHESTTNGFSAVLNVTENGNDLSFTLSVLQGNCKGEAEGKILMVGHEENYHVGFFEPDECPLQFSLMIKEDKIDVKEINLCRMHESGCAFEGTYVKRKN